MEDLPSIVVDERGFLRIRFPDGNMLPELALTIDNEVSPYIESQRSGDVCTVTVTFMARHDLRNK